MPKTPQGQKRKADVIANDRVRSAPPINNAVRMSPAMACGPEHRLWDIGNIMTLIEEAENQKV
jgi:hypothetical protein